MASAAVATEASPSPSRGLLSKARRLKNGTTGSSATSTISNDGSSGSRQGGFRSSIDSAVDKIKTAADTSHERDGEEAKGIVSLIGKQRSKRKAKKRKQKDEDQRASEEAERGRSVAERGTLETGTDARGRSRSRLTEHLAESESSMITVESDEEPLETPPLVSRPSHAGYLTLSSPLIQKPLESNPAHQGAGIATLTKPAHTTAAGSEASALPDTAETDSPTKPDRSPAAELGAPNILDDIPVLKQNSAPTIQSGGSSPRSNSPNSPVEKVKENERALSPAEKLRDGLGGLFGRKPEGEGLDSRRSSLASRRSSKVPEAGPVKPNTTPTKNSPQHPQSAKGALPQQKINTSQATPERPSTPVTTVTPPTPTDARSESVYTPTAASKRAKTPASTSSEGNTNIVTSPSGHMISHRRVRSASAANPPSKLSSAVSAPLTPTIEESKSVTPSPGLSGFSSQNAFFTSVFSAASNAATTFSNTLANNSLNTSNRSRSGTQSSDKNLVKPGGEDIDSTELRPGSRARETADGELRDQTPRAIETLGTGNLSLSHLGIPIEPNTTTPHTPSMATSSAGGTSTLPETNHNASSPGIKHSPVNSGSTLSGAGSVSDDASKTTTGIARTLQTTASDLSSETFASEETATPVAEDVMPGRRPHSLFEGSIAGDQTPPNIKDGDPDGSIRRSGSVRSRMDPATRRKRGGSTATGTTIATAIGASNSVLANPAASGSVPRLTGFAVASKKRNRDFHQLFRSVPEDDYLIEDYSAAVQREILLHGRFYVSEGHVCFNSNIFGYVTTIVISFDEVVSVEKKSTAMLFPNGIVIQTLHNRNIFASFASRDSTYDLLVGIWKISHPNLRSSLNGVQLDEAGGGDKTMVGDDPPGSEDDSEDFDDQEEVYDEDEEDEAGLGSFTEAGDGSVSGSDAGDGGVKTASRKASAAAFMMASATNPAVPNGDSKIERAGVAPAAALDFPGPIAHAPTECGDQDTHYDRLIKDEVVPAPLGKVYTLVFGPASAPFMTKWLLDDQKVLELEMDEEKKGLSLEKRTRNYSYIRPLNASIGPKQTKCIITENLDSIDLEKAVSVTVTTQTPDVPSGNAFSVKSRYCLTWAPGNHTRLLMNCSIEWTGKSWLKGPIEKGATDGQTTYVNDLVAAIKASVSSKSNGTAGALKKTARRRKKDVNDTGAKATGRANGGSKGTTASRSQQRQESWGLLEPFRGLLGPFRPFMTSQVALVIMGIAIVVIWMRQSPVGTSGSKSLSGLTTPERIAAYDEIWRREESQLWEWLEERIELDGLALAREGAGHPRPKDEGNHLERARDDGVGGLAQQRMNEREMSEAIRVTQERLNTLKGMTGKQKENQEHLEEAVEG